MPEARPKGSTPISQSECPENLMRLRLRAAINARRCQMQEEANDELDGSCRTDADRNSWSEPRRDERPKAVSSAGGAAGDQRSVSEHLVRSGPTQRRCDQALDAPPALAGQPDPR